MRGKEKCRALKEIRRQIAEANDIALAVSECTYQGECRGTCPKCESELRFLERELAIRQGLGKAVAVIGLSAGVCASVTACSPTDPTGDPPVGTEELAGEMVAPYEEETAPEEETSPGETEQENTGEAGTENSNGNETENMPEEVEGLLELAGDIAPYEPEDGGEICDPNGDPADE